MIQSCEAPLCNRTQHIALYTYPYPAPGQRATHWLCPEHKSIREEQARKSKRIREQVPGGKP